MFYVTETSGPGQDRAVQHWLPCFVLLQGRGRRQVKSNANGWHVPPYSTLGWAQPNADEQCASLCLEASPAQCGWVAYNCSLHLTARVVSVHLVAGVVRGPGQGPIWPHPLHWVNAGSGCYVYSFCDIGRGTKIIVLDRKCQFATQRLHLYVFIRKGKSYHCCIFLQPWTLEQNSSLCQ